VEAPLHAVELDQVEFHAALGIADHSGHVEPVGRHFIDEGVGQPVAANARHEARARRVAQQLRYVPNGVEGVAGIAAPVEAPPTGAISTIASPIAPTFRARILSISFRPLLGPG
jgi:hypothetical protein